MNIFSLLNEDLLLTPLAGVFEILCNSKSNSWSSVGVGKAFSLDFSSSVYCRDPIEEVVSGALVYSLWAKMYSNVDNGPLF